MPRGVVAHLCAMRSALVLFALSVAPATVPAQSKPLFPGAEHLDSCVVDLPLTYAKKDKERYEHAARFLADEELISAVLDKKTRRVNCTRVYVVAETANDGSTYVYVEDASQRLRMDGLKQAFFPRFRPATERFYNAACFDRRLAAHPELKVHLDETPAEAPKQ
jgi:hypothetical protein